MIQQGIKRLKSLSLAQRGMLVLSAGAVTQSVLQIGVIAVLSRLLLPGDFGVIALLQSFTSFSLILSQFGVTQVIVQRKEIDDDVIKNGTLISIGFGLLISLLFYA